MAIAPDNSRWSPVARRSGFRAFSLIELIAVLVLLSIIMGLATPSLTRFARGRQHKDAASMMLTMLRMARIKAVSDGTNYRFNLDPEMRHCWLTAQEAGKYEELLSEDGVRYEFPLNVTAQWTDPDNGGGAGYITFAPTGEIEPAVISLFNDEQQELQVRAELPTDNFRIHDPNDPAQVQALESQLNAQQNAGAANPNTPSSTNPSGKSPGSGSDGAPAPGGGR